MNQLQQQWLDPAPWESVITINEALCQARQVPHKLKPKTYDRARALWEQSQGRSIPLLTALDLCRKCQELGPFDFFNANTFAAIGKTLMEEGLKQLPPLEAQILRTTVAHYIGGRIKQKELTKVLKHFESLWTSQAAGKPHAPSQSPPQLPPKATA